MPALVAAQETTGRRRASAPTPAAKQTLTPANLEFYLSDDGIAYIRPGLKIKVNSITIGSDRKPVVELTLTDDMDQPLDRLGKTTPGAISISLILAWYDPASRHYTAYTTRTQTTPPSSPRPGVSAVQAGTDSGGTWTDLETGREIRFPHGLPGASTDETHTLASRRASDRHPRKNLRDRRTRFRPDGGAVTDKGQGARQSSCLNCHDRSPLTAAHARRQLFLCHNPQPRPDTEAQDSRSRHKIHFGPNLPSVQAGKPT